MSLPLSIPLTTLFTLLHSEVLVRLGGYGCVLVGSMASASLRISKQSANCFSFSMHRVKSLFLPFSVPPAACPVLCSGNGQYDKGSCVCYSGWKGPECDVPITQCFDPLCNGHGTCTDGNCVCSVGYKGPNCAEGERS